MTPEEELKRLNRLIRQFEAVFKSTKDSFQRDRVTKELNSLKTYKEKLETFHEIDPRELEEAVEYDALGGFPYLKNILARHQNQDNGGMEVEQESYQDREVYHLALYLAHFESEFLSLLSETKLKLDFKHSLERDGFYHRFENLRRLLQDIREDITRMDEYLGQKHEEEMRMRSFKRKRNIILEADKFFRNLIRFSGELTEDISNSGSICLNADDVLHFDKIHGNRGLEGLAVEKALAQLYDFAKEVTGYLNVPQIEAQES